MLKRCEHQTLIAAHTLRWRLLIGGCNRLQQGTVCVAAKQQLYEYTERWISKQQLYEYTERWIYIHT